MLDQNVLNEFLFNLKKVMYVGKIQTLKLTLRVDEPNDPEPYIYLELIIIRKKFRNLGIGSAILRDIVQFADDHNVQVILYAVNCYGSELKGLYRFYRRHGFVLYKNNNEGNFVHYPKKVHKVCNKSRIYSYNCLENVLSK